MLIKTILMKLCHGKTVLIKTMLIKTTTRLIKLTHGVVAVFALHCCNLNFCVFTLFSTSFFFRDVIAPNVKLYIVAILSESRLFTSAEDVVALFILKSERCYIYYLCLVTIH